MDRRGTLILDRLRLRLDQQHRDAFAHQSERHDRADRSGADDNHALLTVGHDPNSQGSAAMGGEAY